MFEFSIGRKDGIGKDSQINNKAFVKVLTPNRTTTILSSFWILSSAVVFKNN